MPTYRIDLELRSALSTPLSADTLWGHVCWGIRYQSGREVLEEWLARYDTGPPPLVMSDPLPAGYWPRPVLPPMPRSETPPKESEAKDRKKLDKVQRLTDAAFRDALYAAHRFSKLIFQIFLLSKIKEYGHGKDYQGTDQCL